MTADLFQNVATLARQQALPGLKSRAEREGKIITICMYCNGYVSEQDGRGVNGLSHGCCAQCEPRMQEELDVLFEPGSLDCIERDYYVSSEGLREGAEAEADPSRFSEDENDDEDESINELAAEYRCVKCGREAIINRLCAMCSELHPELM